MGISSSSNKYQQHCHNEIATTFSTARIPKHLQPLKRKQTSSKKTKNTAGDEVAAAKSATNLTSTIANNNEKVKNKEHTTYSNTQHIGTLQANPNNEIDQIFMDHTSSSHQLFKWTQGRRFQNIDVSDQYQNQSYPLPNDRTELDRHRVQIYILRWAFESRHIVPPMIKQKLFEGIKVLDVGCGPGLWLGHPILDMAQDFYKSSFDSIDICNLLPQPKKGTAAGKENQLHRLSLSKLQDQEEQPEEHDNFKFTCHNIVKDGPIPFEADTFDYVQQSLTTLAYKEQDWKSVLQELKRVTKPGGYIQLIEVDLYPQPLGEQGGLWRDQIHADLKKERGILPRVACQLDQLLTDIGLTEIQTRFVSVPIGSWGLDIGNLWEQNFDAFLESAGPFLVEIMQTTNERYKKDCKMLKQEAKRYRAFNNIHIAYGQVPFT